MKSRDVTFVLALILVGGLLTPGLAHAGLESSLMGIKMKLTGVILPLLSVIGIAIASISLFTGNPNSKQHIVFLLLVF